MSLVNKKPARHREKMCVIDRTQEVTLKGALAYAAPSPGINFFYMPMWSILPAVYVKYFGVPLTAIATVILVIRIFDGFTDIAVGFTSDWHRSRGGSRKSWVVVGSLGSIGACYFLFVPSGEVDAAYYFLWSLVYFLAFTIATVPLTTWGSEITFGYQPRARVYAILAIFGGMGGALFSAMPLLPLYDTHEYTLEVLHDSFYAGALITAAGLAWMLAAAPTGTAHHSNHLPQGDSVALMYRSIAGNRPLLIYYAAYVFVGLAPGMWFGLVFIYFDSYIGIGEYLPLVFLVSIGVLILASALWPKLIERSDKRIAWALGIAIFGLSLVGTLFLRPGNPWWIALIPVSLIHIFFGGHNVVALAILGDIIDYTKLRFKRDRGAIYFGLNNLVFKIALGVGGALSLAIAGSFQFDPAEQNHSGHAILGLKLGFIILPALFSLIGLAFILRLPISRRRHGIIRRRLDSLNARFSRDHEAPHVLR